MDPSMLDIIGQPHLESRPEGDKEGPYFPNGHYGQIVGPTPRPYLPKARLRELHDPGHFQGSNHWPGLPGLCYPRRTTQGTEIRQRVPVP